MSLKKLLKQGVKIARRYPIKGRWEKCALGMGIRAELTPEGAIRATEDARSLDNE